jgi:hypothetical protein
VGSGLGPLQPYLAQNFYVSMAQNLYVSVAKNLYVSVAQNLYVSVAKNLYVSVAQNRATKKLTSERPARFVGLVLSNCLSLPSAVSRCNPTDKQSFVFQLQE